MWRFPWPVWRRDEEYPGQEKSQASQYVLPQITNCVLCLAPCLLYLQLPKSTATLQWDPGSSPFTKITAGSHWYEADSATRSVIFNQGSLERRGQTQTNRCCPRERWPNSWSEGQMEGEGRGWAVLTLAGLLTEDWTSYQTSYNTERWQESFREVTTHDSSKDGCSVPAVAGQDCSLHGKRRPGRQLFQR